MSIIDFGCQAFVKETLECVLFYHGVDPGLEGILLKESLQALPELRNYHFRLAFVLGLDLKVKYQVAKSAEGLGDIFKEL